MRILFIDDEQIRYDIFSSRFLGDTIVFASTIEAADVYLQNDRFDMISFDYDMFDPKLQTYLNTTGIAKKFIKNCPQENVPKFITLHSINPQGSWHLFHILSDFTKVFLCPFRLETPAEYKLAMELL